jgi:hypothetical protein
MALAPEKMAGPKATKTQSPTRPTPALCHSLQPLFCVSEDSALFAENVKHAGRIAPAKKIHAAYKAS